MAIPLIQAFDGLDESSMHDLLVMMAKNMEDALIECGAVPGEDYTHLDLFRLAQPYVLERFRDGNLSYTKGWKV